MLKDGLSTENYLKEAERDVKRLEIRSILARSAREKYSIVRALGEKRKLVKSLQNMTTGGIEYR